MFEIDSVRWEEQRTARLETNFFTASLLLFFYLPCEEVPSFVRRTEQKLRWDISRPAAAQNRASLSFPTPCQCRLFRSALHRFCRCDVAGDTRNGTLSSVRGGDSELCEL